MEPEDSSATLFNTSVSDIQEDVAITSDDITGTLKYLASGDIADYWGAGNFLALKFTPDDSATSVRAGLDPSQGSGLVELDEDLNGVWKITDKNTQVFKVVTTDGTHTHTQTFDLSALVCETDDED